ncbi:MAG: hypothetical protein IJG09_06445 [Methanobrevibacter sp.]|nr:hypothetical protein [Methanobrevibacter sp.]
MKLLDNSCLSLFMLEIPQYDFILKLNDLNESLNITNHVKDEFGAKDVFGKLNEYISNGLISLEYINYDIQLERRYPMLGRGELSIIQWGLILKDKVEYYCILDDLNARKVALKLGLSISGSIGLIIILKNRNNYSRELIDRIIFDIEKSNFRVSKKVLNELRA